MNQVDSRNLKSRVQITASSFVIPAVSLFVTQNPTWMIPWFFAQGFLSTIFQLQQERINSFVEDLKDNMAKIDPSIIDTSDFKLVFVKTIENYLGTRNKEKLSVVTNIFLGYVNEMDKEHYELERFYSTLNIISIDGVEFIRFIISDLFDDEELNIEISRALSGFFSNDENKIKFPITFKTIKERLSELQALGIIRMSGYATIADPRSFQDNIYYSLTDFGIKFMLFLKPSQKTI